ncbi:FAD-dependent oxidoreductase, partial [bacterium]|nr:FAD-dependent oxidoreductase [bacterium]
ILGTREDNIASWSIARKSIDAREKSAIRIIYAVDVDTREPLKNQGRDGEWLPLGAREEYQFPQCVPGGEGREVVVVGAGPAGIVFALLLAENGCKPTILERGGDVDARMASVRRFWDSGALDPESNMQFGEGGAGTFSDGKLSTSVGDAMHRNRKVIDEFLEAGAPPEIAYIGKPHIGTDCLVGTLKRLRAKIESLGGSVRFGAKVTSLEIAGGRIKSVTVNGAERIEARAVVLAIGHSARDTFEAVAAGGLAMERKPFAIGLRIEHPQAMVQRSQFGASWKHPRLPAADYKLTFQSSGGRGVYSFCMCPGGFVVNSSSEPGMVACNGMSNFARDERNANSAIVAAVRTEDFGGEGVLAGIEFQRAGERAAFEAANAGRVGFAMPIQRYDDFVAGEPTKAYGEVRPCSKGDVRFADLNACLPPFVADAIKEAIPAFDRKIRGFARPDALLTGVETRTSSPVRILRGESMESSAAGLYPCGEGAGYAGGIMSAAMDGIRVAEAIATGRGGTR